ncbi:MAG: XkdX family protein [Synergistaceae bacterium]|nr:XkdX family protein [Synergistaceae bacterium]
MNENFNFYIAKRYYERGLWDEANLRKFVAKNYLTADEFKTITGHNFKELELSEKQEQDLVDEIEVEMLDSKSFSQRRNNNAVINNKRI